MAWVVLNNRDSRLDDARPEIEVRRNEASFNKSAMELMGIARGGRVFILYDAGSGEVAFVKASGPATIDGFIVDPVSFGSGNIYLGRFMGAIRRVPSGVYDMAKMDHNGETVHGFRIGERSSP